MVAGIFERVFKVYREELRLFLWVTFLLLLLKVSTILLNNYAQTAFLKRFGVQYLPLIFLINSVLVLFIANILGAMMDRYGAMIVFIGLLAFYAVAVGVIRVLIPYDIVLVYPVLFVLKTQTINTLPLLYWNILNNIFTTRQSKRIFTLITAGGIAGTTLGSLATPSLSRFVGMDNVLYLFCAGMILTAILNLRTEKVVQAPLQVGKGRRRRPKKEGFFSGIREITGLFKTSPLMKYMVLLMAIPNILLPILNYQFNVVVDETYPTETGALRFFGLFRGISNGATFLILMFSGRFLAKMGVSVSLLFHPLNYLLAFAALFFRFDIIAGIYARFSTDTLKSALNNPARAVLYNFFPSHIRGRLRAFLRGVVVKAGGLAGAGLLLLLKDLLEPRWFSLIAAPFALAWIAASFLLNRSYSQILIDVLMQKQIDWRRLEQMDLAELVRDKRTATMLTRVLREDSTETSLLCADILALAGFKDLGPEIVRSLRGKPPPIQKALLERLRPERDGAALPLLVDYASKAPSEELPALVEAIGRLDKGEHLRMLVSLLDHSDLDVAVSALAGVYQGGDREGIEKARGLIRRLLESGEPDSVKRALRGLTTLKDRAFVSDLVRLAREGDEEQRALALEALGTQEAPEGVEPIVSGLEDPRPPVRKGAVAAVGLSRRKDLLGRLIERLGDEDPGVRDAARDAILKMGKETAPELIKGLGSFRREIRNQILSILNQMDVKKIEVSDIIRKELEAAYRNLAYAEVIRRAGLDGSSELLRRHLMEKNSEILNTVFRILEVADPHEVVPVIQKGLKSKDRRDLGNAIEALENYLNPRIGAIMVPLVEDVPVREKLAAGRKRLGLEPPEQMEIDQVLKGLLEEGDKVTQMLVLYTMADKGPEGIPLELIEPLGRSSVPEVREPAVSILARMGVKVDRGEEQAEMMSTMEKIIRLKKIHIFSDLQIRELTAISSVTKVREYKKGEIIIREGEMGDVMYLVIDGEVSVIKNYGKEDETLLAVIRSDDYFGEMSLFDSQPRSASIRAEKDTRLLELGKIEFEDIMREYPQIAISICQEFSKRIRKSHERLEELQREAGACREKT